MLIAYNPKVLLRRLHLRKVGNGSVPVNSFVLLGIQALGATISLTRIGYAVDTPLPPLTVSVPPANARLLSLSSTHMLYLGNRALGVKALHEVVSP